MKDKKDAAVADRRRFLKLAGVSVVTGGGALVAETSSVDAATAPKSDRGLYRETEHVRKYYELARN